MKTNRCTHDNKDITLADCQKCHRLCIYSPHTLPAGLWDREMIRRWGGDEIERFVQEGRGGCVSPSESGIAASDPGTIEETAAL